MVADILPADPYPPSHPIPLTLWLGSKGQNSTFSEHGHVAYQIKDNHGCSNMVADILPAYHTPSDSGVGVYRSKFNFFRTWSCCISKLRDYICSNMVANILPADPVRGHVAYQIQENHICSNMVANIFPEDTPPSPDPGDGVSR